MSAETTAIPQNPAPSPNVSPNPGPAVAVEPAAAKKRPRRLGLWITLGIFAILILGGYLTYRYYFHARINPTNLKDKELVVLNQKLDQIETSSAESQTPAALRPGAETPDGVLIESNQVRMLPSIEQEKMKEQAAMAKRTIILSEREINGILNHNTDLGQRLKFSLKPGYIDIQYAQPFDDEVALVGGKTLRLSLDISLKKAEGGQMALTVRDVNVAGVPMPSAWLEPLGINKGENLLGTFGDEYPLLQSFVNGIELIDISSGEMRIRLAE